MDAGADSLLDITKKTRREVARLERNCVITIPSAGALSELAVHLNRSWAKPGSESSLIVMDLRIVMVGLIVYSTGAIAERVGSSGSLSGADCEGC